MLGKASLANDVAGGVPRASGGRSSLVSGGDTCREIEQEELYAKEVLS